MDLEGLGKAISEAIALRQLMATLEKDITNIETTIINNEKEINRRKALEETNITLGVEKGKLDKELNERQSELNQRMAILNKAGVELPLDKPVSGSTVSL